MSERTPEVDVPTRDDLAERFVEAAKGIEEFGFRDMADQFYRLADTLEAAEPWLIPAIAVALTERKTA